MGSRAEADLRAQQKASSFLRGARAGGSSDLPRPGRGRGGCGATPPRPSSRSRFIISRLRCAPSGCPPHPHPSPRVLDFSPTAAPRTPTPSTRHAARRRPPSLSPFRLPRAPAASVRPGFLVSAASAAAGELRLLLLPRLPSFLCCLALPSICRWIRCWSLGNA
jgi:hypothetical protein